MYGSVRAPRPTALADKGPAEEGRLEQPSFLMQRTPMPAVNQRAQEVLHLEAGLAQASQMANILNAENRNLKTDLRLMIGVTSRISEVFDLPQDVREQIDYLRRVAEPRVTADHTCSFAQDAEGEEAKENVEPGPEALPESGRCGFLSRFAHRLLEIIDSHKSKSNSSRASSSKSKAGSRKGSPPPGWQPQQPHQAQAPQPNSNDDVVTRLLNNDPTLTLDEFDAQTGFLGSMKALFMEVSTGWFDPPPPRPALTGVTR